MIIDLQTFTWEDLPEEDAEKMVISKKVLRKGWMVYEDYIFTDPLGFKHSRKRAMFTKKGLLEMHRQLSRQENKFN